MQFRVRATSIQLLRSAPPSDQGKSGSLTVVGVLRRQNPKIAEDLKGKLSADELREVEAFIKSRDEASSLEARVMALRLPEVVANFVSMLDGAAEEEKELLMSYAKIAVTDLRRAINRHSA
ncbi:hypothetical protein VQH23_05450 [Pararoseomonas sp. SCSIO 73927]|uniref:hypothetical protein n=1 Tax=Pararoseomonas sp. SCSIO 73927 TaxID=3114537 RepID=UPI0030CEB396